MVEKVSVNSSGGNRFVIAQNSGQPLLWQKNGLLVLLQKECANRFRWSFPQPIKRRTRRWAGFVLLRCLWPTLHCWSVRKQNTVNHVFRSVLSQWEQLFCSIAKKSGAKKDPHFVGWVWKGLANESETLARFSRFWDHCVSVWMACSRSWRSSAHGEQMVGKTRRWVVDVRTSRLQSISIADWREQEMLRLRLHQLHSQTIGGDFDITDFICSHVESHWKCWLFSLCPLLVRDFPCFVTDSLRETCPMFFVSTGITPYLSEKFTTSKKKDERSVCAHKKGNGSNRTTV